MTQNETPAPFMPFVPPGAEQPPQSGDVLERHPDGKVKRAKKPRSKVKGINARADLVQKQTAAIANTTLSLNKRRKSAPAKRSPKYDLQTILRVASTLKEPDQKMFENLLGELSAMPKAARGRVLKALNEVFG